MQLYDWNYLFNNLLQLQIKIYIGHSKFDNVQIERKSRLIRINTFSPHSEFIWIMKITLLAPRL